MNRIYKLLPHLVFIALLISILIPSLVEIENKWVFLGVVIAIEVTLLVYRKSKSSTDIALIIFAFLLLWEFVTTKIPNPNAMLIPVPERVFAIFVTDWSKILKGIWRSMSLLFTALFFAVLLGMSLGLLVGWFERLRSTFFPIAKIISPIPPIIYSPYAIAILPTFRTSSLFIIFSSLFWPLFINMIVSVSNIDRKILESAKTLNTRSFPMFLHILFPYCLPRVLNGMNVTLSTSFVVLTAAELVGADSGLGWFVKFYADFADYTRVVAGIIVIGIVITILNKLLVVVQKLVIRWK